MPLRRSLKLPARAKTEKLAEDFQVGAARHFFGLGALPPRTGGF